MNLGWSAAVAPPLQPTHTFDVTVQAKVSDVRCTPSASCKVTILNIPVSGSDQNIASVNPYATDAGLKLWPNPNNGDQLNVSLMVIAQVASLNMNIFDLSGKLMATHMLYAQDGQVNTTINAQAQLATGMYMVQITTGEKNYNQHLVIQK